MILHPEPLLIVLDSSLTLGLVKVTILDDNPVTNLAMFVFLDEQVSRAKRARPKWPRSHPPSSPRHWALVHIYLVVLCNIFVGLNDGIKDGSLPFLRQSNRLLGHVSSLDFLGLQ